jgi:hypothetical protein
MKRAARKEHAMNELTTVSQIIDRITINSTGLYGSLIERSETDPGVMILCLPNGQRFRMEISDVTPATTADRIAERVNP